MNDRQLSEKEAYLAMYSFLKSWYEMTRSDDVGSLLGSMSLLEDGGTADPAIWADWCKAVERAMAGEVDTGLDLA